MFLLTQEALAEGQTNTWTWPCKTIISWDPWIDLVEPWGPRACHGQQVPPLLCFWPVPLQVILPQDGGGTLLGGTFTLALWPLPLLQVQEMDLHFPIVLGEMVWYQHPGAPPLVATILSQDGKVANVMSEGRDLPLMLSVSLLSYCPA